VTACQTKTMDDLYFNPKSSTIMHIDLNSCFATIEQQANPHLRGKPIAVAAYTTPSGCIIAPSMEAKIYGIKVGMRVKDGKLLYPNLMILPPDPAKYRNVHLQLRRLISAYTNDFSPKSIDEFVLNMENFPCLRVGNIQQVAGEIKRKIKSEIGEWLTVSVGIAPNRFLAKLAAGLHKPDGLDEINKDNFLVTYSNLSLTDLPYIKTQNMIRLNGMGIFTVLEFARAPLWKLKAAFRSILGYYWYLRLRGWEIDDVEFARRSYGNSYALPKPLVKPEELSPILNKLVEKTGFRLRSAGYKARGIHLSLLYRDWSYWHKGVTCPRAFFDSRDIYRQAYGILVRVPVRKPVREMAVSVFNLIKDNLIQLDLFEDVVKRQGLVKALDEVNKRWGNYIITPARMLTANDAVPDRIAFGGVKELEELLIGNA
jgi:DNA polymerase-4